MKLISWDPDLQTLLNRIFSGDLNLQPDFQRGEVWGDQKKRRLIDTILREWHIPPVHVVVDPETDMHEVLDGQQRLAAIRDFALGDLTIDGTCLPHDPEIFGLNGLTYSDLPEKFRRRFDTYALRVIRITDFKPDEPGELFFRLNQPSNLTAAEQRNAFYGQARAQVKELVSEFEKFGVSSEVLGFKNSRMAYDDVIAKVCYSHHVGDIRTKVTAGMVTTMYRSGEPFRQDAVQRVRESLALFGAAGSLNKDLKFNKATFFSWLIFLSVLQKERKDSLHVDLAIFMYKFEQGRQQVRDSRISYRDSSNSNHFHSVPIHNQRRLMEIFNDRAASRVADVSSVLTRDLILWIFYQAQSVQKLLNEAEPSHDCISYGEGVPHFTNILLQLIQQLNDCPEEDVDLMLERCIEFSNWGAAL